jgi:rare lipoprotein A
MGGLAFARNLILIAAAGLLLAGCAGPHYSGGHRHYALGRPHYTVAPYEVNGAWYYPKVDYAYDRTGTASWYGPGFDGHATADGEIYDMNDVSAAHKTLPLPSVVEVTNLQNGRELTLRVNDRGPFVGDRLIDLSRRAAQLLGFERSGTAPVRIRIVKDASIKVAEAAMLGEVGPVEVASTRRTAPRVELAAAAAASPPAAMPRNEPPPSLRAAEVIAAPLPQQQQTQEAQLAFSPPPPRSQQERQQRDYWPSLIAPAQAETLYPPPRRAARIAASVIAAAHGRIFVQAGAFAVPENAQRVRARIAVLGNAEIIPARVDGVVLYQVRLGPAASDAEALRLLSAVVERGFAGAQLVDR